MIVEKKNAFVNKIAVTFYKLAKMQRGNNKMSTLTERNITPQKITNKFIESMG